MSITVGIDVGTGAVKAVVMDCSGEPKLLAHETRRIRKRAISAVVDEVLGQVLEASGVDQVDYIGSTGDGEEIPYATGHFYGMTTHARGALFLEPRARAVLDIGALHARAVAMDERGKVLDYKMTSQCASGSGQFLENIARYLGVSLPEVGPLSLQAAAPENVSSICAVLAETDVINMVSRGISTPDILRGIHDSMAGRFGRLLRSLKASGHVFLSGGLALDVGLQEALRRSLAEGGGKRTGPPAPDITLATSPLSIHAGALGAAIWGAYRYARLGSPGAAWTSTAPLPTHESAH
jgi:benzoyl-CoA reductase subunit D